MNAQALQHLHKSALFLFLPADFLSGIAEKKALPAVADKAFWFLRLRLNALLLTRGRR